MKPRYTRTAISLHWLVALGLAAVFALGLYMQDLPLSPTKLKLYSWHKWAGVSLFLLMSVRLGWRLAHPHHVAHPPDGGIVGVGDVDRLAHEAAHDRRQAQDLAGRDRLEPGEVLLLLDDGSGANGPAVPMLMRVIEPILLVAAVRSPAAVIVLLRSISRTFVIPPAGPSPPATMGVASPAAVTVNDAEVGLPMSPILLPQKKTSVEVSPVRTVGNTCTSSHWFLMAPSVQVISMR